MDRLMKALAMLVRAYDAENGPVVPWDRIEAEGFTRGEWSNVIMPALALAGYEYVGGDGGYMLNGGPGLD